MPVFRLVGENISEVTVPPINSVMENRAPDIISDRSSTSRDAGHLYGFMILESYRLGANLSLQEEGFGLPTTAPQRAAPSEYFFAVSPRSINVSEPSTVTVSPTMGRNYLVEHQGSLLKQLSISGTTGFRPMSSSAKAPPSVGGRVMANILARTTSAAIDIIDSVTAFSSLLDPRNLPADEVTGYFNFMQLRNLFRRYNYRRANPSSDGRIPYMVWVNFHEYEFWICEPQTFNVRRDASNPLTFGYDITATLLKKLDNLGLDEDWLRRMISFWDVPGTINTIISKASNVLLTLSRFPEAVVSDVTGTTRRFFNSLEGFVNSLSAFKESYSAVPELGDRIVSDIKDQAQSLKDTWDAEFSTRISVSAQYEDIDNSNVFTETIRIMNRYRALRRDALATGIQKGSNEALRREQAAYQRSGDRRERDTNYPKGATSNFGELSDIRNDSGFGGNVGRTIVGIGEDIRMIAKRVYGNEAPWKRLVLFNGLRYPYIAHNRGTGIIQHGDTILVPGLGTSSITSIDGNLVLHTDPADFEDNINNLDPEVVLYGRDLKVNFDSHQTTNGIILDFALTPSGDIATVEGRNNLKQALTLLTNTAAGELKLHPGYGFPKLVGTRVTSSTTAIWILQAQRAIGGEPRIATVADMSVAILGDALIAKLELVAEGNLSRIPITTLQRV